MSPAFTRALARDSTRASNRDGTPVDPIQEMRPLQTAIPRGRILLPVEDIHPAIRLAHRATGPLEISSRIIFDHELVLIVRGTGQLRFPRQTIEYSARHLFVIPPFVPHEFHSQGTCEHLAIHFDLAPGVPRRASAARRPYTVRLTQGQQFPLHLVLLENDPIARAMARVIQLRQSDDPLDTVAARIELLQALLLLLRRQPRTARSGTTAREALSNARMERAMAFIRTHWRTLSSAQEVASAAGVSVSQLNRIAQSWMGQSTMEIVRRTKVEQARRMLADDLLSIKEVAAACGFASPYHFSKVFRRIDGLPPTEYRASVLKLASRVRQDA
jgi:AraC-like DNA-binding protein